MFKNVEKDAEKKQYFNMTDEHFIVWMQMESFPDFIKLYGRIDQNLDVGNYTIKIKSGIIILYND